FELCHNEGLTYKQVAEKLGITDSTVNSQMVKALKSIKDFLLLKGTVLLISLLLFG
ncbi:MAG TPA: sigma factor-like helix-turn-helix DNA-binding protein, partial [Sphingobacteriaceae bacterium]